MLESGFQLQRASADIFSCGLECDRRLFVEKLRWLRRNPRVDCYNTGHYCSPRLFAAWAVSIPAINPHWRTSFTSGSSFKLTSAELRYRIFGCRTSKTPSFSNTSRLALAAAHPRAFPV